jgi:ABC-2 type transport system permease protein
MSKINSKKRFFNVRLFLDAIKQLRLIGIITFIVTLCGSLLFPFGAYQDMMNAERNIAAGATSMVPYFVNIDTTAPLLFIFMFLAPLIFILYLFRFQNKRNGSDFFHSVPDSRIALYTSYAAAALAWLYAIILAVLGILSVIYIVFLGSCFNLNFIPYLLFTFLVGTTLVAGATLVAVSATGTILTNITLTGIVLFLPRLVTFMLTYCILNLLPNMAMDNFGMLTNINYNIPLKFLVYISPLSAVNGNKIIDDTSKYTFLPAYFYTLAVAVIFIFLAAFFFTRRKSETAQKSAPNRMLQHVYRCAITLPFTLLVTAAILSMTSYHDSHMIMSIIVLILVSLFVYFIYELITTKKLMNLVKAAPVFLVLVLLNGFFYLWLTGIKTADLSFNPTASEISSVQIWNYDLKSSNPDQHPTWDSGTGQIKLTDPDFNDFISQKVKDSNTSITSPQSGFSTGSNTYYKFKINLKNGSSVERILYLNEDKDKPKMVKATENNAEYKKVSYTLPNDKDITYTAIPNIKQDVTQKIWNSFRNEYNSLSDSEKDQIFKSTQPSGETLMVKTSIGIVNNYLYYPFTSLTPITSQWAMEEQNNTSRNEVTTYISKIQNLDKFDHNSTITFQGKELPKIFANYAFGNYYYDNGNGNTHSTYSLQDEKQMISLVAKSITQKPDITQPFAEITLSSTIGGKTYHYYVTLDNDTINQIVALIPKLKPISN